jgi:hypothetical protein
MKLYKVSLFFALLVALSVPVVAQASLQFDIPFAFVAGDKSLPAGHYRVSPASKADGSPWSISGRDGSVMILTNRLESITTAHAPTMVFWHSGGVYSLVQFWPHEYSGRELLLKPKVKTTILAESGKYYEIGAE